jgi:acetylglutamate/LysW-gamma-L-alpha-aminoadipate kinase
MDFAYGRMKKKLIAAGEALDGGVARVVIASSQQPDPVERALDGMGTVLA